MTDDKVDVDQLQAMFEQPWSRKLALSAVGEPTPTSDLYGSSRIPEIADSVAAYQQACENLTAHIATDAMRNAVESMAEQLEYELRGAWRAGYDYVHVYDDPTPTHSDDFGEQVTIRQYVYPGNEGDPRPDPPNMVYRYSYDLTSVSDDVIRDAIRGDIEVSDE